MKRWRRCYGMVAVLLFAATTAVAAPGSDTSTAGYGQPLVVKRVTVLIGNRVFPDFRDVETAPLGKWFRVGDTDYSAKIIQFVADFVIDSKKHRISSRSNVPRNPACRIVVREKGVPKDTTWAFVNFPPHFSPRSVISFRVLKVEFMNAPSVSAVIDTSSAPAPASPEKKK